MRGYNVHHYQDYYQFDSLYIYQRMPARACLTACTQAEEYAGLSDHAMRDVTRSYLEADNPLCCRLLLLCADMGS
ncbi:hypothetical protein MASR1M65_28500 [Saprospiraceae bacterium]